MDVDALPERLRSKIEVVENGCWLWTGACGAGGYGLLTFEQVPLRAHRAVWEILVGPIPDGRELDHLCQVKLCVRPLHLEPVTHQENMRRAFDTPTCGNGHLWTEANTRIRPGNGQRYCADCNREKAKRRYDRLVST